MTRTDRGEEKQVASKDEQEVGTSENVESPAVVAAVAPAIGRQCSSSSNYYKSTPLPPSSSASISLIGSLQVFFLYAGGPLTGRIFDAYGTAVLIPLGSVLCVFAMMMVSLAQKDQAYQLFLSHGVVFGIGIALMFNPAVAVVGHWFRRRRATAIGVVLSGGAVGGVVPASRSPATSPGARRSTSTGSGTRDTSSPPFLGSCYLFYALFSPYFYIQMYASFRGVPPSVSSYLLAILNAMNVPSRVLPGILADRFGPLGATDEQHFRALIVFTGVLLAVGAVALVGAAAVVSVYMSISAF
ncbi:MFS general substrate transporter [Ganoderma sinense ZZ0214-1]|uniref:MFS general substrate transporter n=1 Tax=Ganoderma sinense ZZ0214-1 TaxID=1077348 RepID=A0A2G8S6W0_9APHY|nr:MFS general substrate transporter [Ganoderma sinense ZZ0214-1]